MQTRQQALHEWLINFFGHDQFMISPLAGDASFRRYFRIHQQKNSYVLMDAPPEKEAILPFINVTKKLAEGGIHSPKIHAMEPKQGFLLLEDLGDSLFLNALSAENADGLYKNAMDILLKIQQCSMENPSLPAFDISYMLLELDLFRQWFLGKYLQLSLTIHEEKMLTDSFHWLTKCIAEQPRVFIHRDYHSRNLMLLSKLDLGVIDYQDAMQGPFTYDLVSLLKDCYVQWPRDQVLDWLDFFYEKMPNRCGWSKTDFIRGFDLCGLQRHLKVLGIFCRLHFRDYKSAYLNDLPLIFNYAVNALDDFPQLKSLFDFFHYRLQAPFYEKQKCTPQ
jgi:aminoglycoside/choline kinase family phosphotransferase